MTTKIQETISLNEAKTLIIGNSLEQQRTIITNTFRNKNENMRVKYEIVKSVAKNKKTVTSKNIYLDSFFKVFGKRQLINIKEVKKLGLMKTYQTIIVGEADEQKTKISEDCKLYNRGVFSDISLNIKESQHPSDIIIQDKVTYISAVQCANLMIGNRSNNLSMLGKYASEGKIKRIKNHTNGRIFVDSVGFIEYFADRICFNKVKTAKITHLITKKDLLIAKEIFNMQDVLKKKLIKETAQGDKAVLEALNLSKNLFVRYVRENTITFVENFIKRNTFPATDYHTMNVCKDSNNSCFDGMMRGFDIAAGAVIGGLAVNHGNGVDAFILEGDSFIPVEFKFCKINTKNIIMDKNKKLFYVPTTGRDRKSIEASIKGSYEISPGGCLKAKRIATYLVIVDENNRVIDAYYMSGDMAYEKLKYKETTDKNGEKIEKTSTNRSITLSQFIKDGHKAVTVIPEHVIGFENWCDEQRQLILERIEEKVNKKLNL